MKFYISREDLHRILKGCDLGDSVGVRAYVYPHTDDLWRLVACLTAEPFMETEKAATALQKTEETTCACGHEKRQHIYEEGACRPGFVCEKGCDKYEVKKADGAHEGEQK